MKRIFCIYICMLLGIVSIYADNVVQVVASDGQPGDVVPVSLSLKNDDDIAAAEFQIPLNEQLGYVDGSLSVDKSHVGTSHQVSVSFSKGILKVYFYSLVSGAVLPKADGTLFSFNIRLRNVPGVYDLKPAVKLSDIHAKALQYTAKGTKVTILAPQLELSTTQIDFGEIAIREVYEKTCILKNVGTTPLEVSNIKFGNSFFSTKQTAFTINAGSSQSLTISCSPTSRGKVETTMTVTSNAVNKTETIAVMAKPYSVNELHIGNASGVSDAEVSIPITMKNMEAISAVQFFIPLPEELEYVDGSLSTTPLSSKMSASSTMSNGVLRCFLYTMSATNHIAEGDGVIATFRLRLKGKNGSYELNPTSVILGLETKENIVSDVKGGKVSIQSPIIEAMNTVEMPSSAYIEGIQTSYCITNKGSVNLTINNVTFLNDCFSIGETLPLTIGPNKSRNLTLRYLPKEPGDFATTMQIYSNDPEERVKSVSLTGSTFAPNTLNVSRTISKDGKRCMITVGMDNCDEVVALHMNVQGLEGMMTSRTKMSLTTRCDTHTPIVVRKNDGSYNIDLYSNSNKSVADNEGQLFSIVFESNKPIVSDDSEVVLDDIKLANIKSQNIASETRATSGRHLINLVIKNGDELLDKTRIVFNESQKMEYESTCDAQKFLTAGLPCQFYSYDSNGCQYQINERPIGNGIVPLGLIVTKPAKYTIAATRLDRTAILYDRQLNIEHDLSTGGYTFTCLSGTFDQRFELHTPIDLLGDADGNGEVNISDIVAIVNHINGETPTIFNKIQADVDANGTIDNKDIEGIKVIILEEDNF